MRWPLSQDFNEAVQCPGLSFADPDLKGGRAVVGARGLPLPRSGNFADVYQFRTAGRDFAVKCFTRPVVGLDQRYEQVGRALAKANLPFTVAFTYLDEGIRVAGAWRPVVKMDWVDGLQLNQFVGANAGNPAALDALLRLWVRLGRRLRGAGVAHADLQHGNVLLVPGPRPGALSVKLIDYDGMYVPALANTPSGEAGHPCYQHPDRAAKNVYSKDLDRFPLLVVATALKGLTVLGPQLWERFDTGDNLLFQDSDFTDPAGSALIRDLWAYGDPTVRELVGHLAAACRKPIPQTPWLDHFAPDGAVMPTGGAGHGAAEALGFAPPVGAAVPAAPPDPSAFADLTRDVGPRRASRRGAGGRVLVVGGAVVIATGLALAAVFLGGGQRKPDETVQTPPPGKPDEPGPAPPPEEQRAPAPVPPPPAAPVPPEASLAVAPEPRPVGVVRPAVAPRPRAVVAEVRPATPARPPAPAGDALAKAEANVRMVLKDDYARKKPGEKKGLAQKLIGLADGTTDDAAARYVMLRDARDIAAEVGDPVLAAQAIDGLAKWYEIDPAAAKLAAFDKVLGSSSNNAALRTVNELAAAGADAAFDADNYTDAVKLAQTAATAARKGGLGPAAIEDADFRLSHLKKTRDAFDAAQPSLEKLKAAPDDADANLVAGKFRCYIQGRWADGVKLLAKGSSAALKAAAELELAAPASGPADVKVAEAWWDIAQAGPDGEKRPAEARARYWYVRAVPGLMGLARAKAEGRLGFTHNTAEYKPGLLAEFTSKLPAILKRKTARLDPVIDFSAGEFTDAKTADVSVKWTGVILPPRPGRYRLVAGTTDPVRVRADGKVVIDTIANKNGKREGSVLLPDRPANLVVEFTGLNTAAHTLKLSWVPPGGAEEVIPAEALFHDRKTEAALGK